MSLLDKMEAELKQRPRYGPGKYKLVNWPLERIAKLVEYVRANEDWQSLSGPTPSKEELERIYARLQAARQKLGLREE